MVVSGRTELFYCGISAGGNVRTVKVILNDKVNATNQYLHVFNRTVIAISVAQFGLTDLAILPVPDELLEASQCSGATSRNTTDLH